MDNSENSLKLESINVDNKKLNSLNLKDQMKKIAGKISDEKRRVASGLLDELEGKTSEKAEKTDNDREDR